jgi:hypothetical protein
MRAATARAFATGLRLSSVPANTTAGTRGKAPAGGMCRALEGQRSHSSTASPASATRGPKSPKAPGGKPVTSADACERRCVGGVSGAHGSAESSQSATA